MKRIIALLLFCLIFASCANDSDIASTTTAPQDTTKAPETTSLPETTVPETDEPKAALKIINDYLLPLESYSWEREYAPEYVVIHFTSAVVNHRDDPYNMAYIRQTFTDYGVSINYIIDRDGTVYCYIPEERAAWHAGKGTLSAGEKYTNALNKYSIGIELVGMGSASDMSQYLTEKEYAALDRSLIGFTDAQYTSLSLLVDDICTRYGIEKDREHIIGHEDYSPAKTDPGELFDWGKILNGETK